MVVYYLDTSAILKRYRTEKGTEVVEALYGLPDVFLVTSHFACLEVEAVSAKLLKGKSLTEEAYDALLNAFAADLGDPLYAVPLTSRIVNEAIEAARQYAVRAPDAIHIASGLAVQSVSGGDDFFFVSSDKEQLSAASSAGMQTLDPEAENAMDILKKQK